MKNSDIADGLQFGNWSGVSIGDKAILTLAIEALRQSVDYESKFRTTLEAEHKLSDAYIRIRELVDTLAIPVGSDIWVETENAVRSLRDSKEALEKDVSTLTNLLEEREWAEHCTSTPLGKRLESAITDLHDEANQNEG